MREADRAAADQRGADPGARTRGMARLPVDEDEEVWRAIRALTVLGGALIVALRLLLG